MSKRIGLSLFGCKFLCICAAVGFVFSFWKLISGVGSDLECDHLVGF